jgi:peptide subunit release factor 1 (eRF1)
MAAVTGGLMDTEETLPAPNGVSPFERIRRTNAAGAEYWSSRDLAQVLSYSDYRSFEQVIRRAETICLNSSQQIDHFGEITEMVPLALLHSTFHAHPSRLAQTRGYR